MQRLDLSLDKPAMNLALDEALLGCAEEQGGESIRFWRFQRSVVVIGRGSKVREEVNVDYCQSQSIPILRRCSGGASIVAGPDCLMYSVVLDLVRRPELRSVDVAHQFVINHLAGSVRKQQSAVQWQGTCDLTIDDRKFSGNSLRIARNHLLYHGTILQSVDPAFVQMCLKTAPRQPEYRAGREHDEFVTGITIDPVIFCDDLAQRFGATEVMTDWPATLAKSLYDSKYALPEWNWRH